MSKEEGDQRNLHLIQKCGSKKRLLIKRTILKAKHTHTHNFKILLKKSKFGKERQSTYGQSFLCFLGSTGTFISCSLKDSCENALPFSSQKSRILTDFLQHLLKCIKKKSEQLQALHSLGLGDILAIFSRCRGFCQFKEIPFPEEYLIYVSLGRRYNN